MLLLLATVAVLGAVGCASKHMEPVAVSKNSEVLAENQSAVVFFRDTVLGGAIQAPVVEYAGADVQFVGIISANTRLLHKTAPGRHVYVVGGEGANLLEAELAPKKFYYVRVEPKIGLFKARFALEPVEAFGESGEKLEKALEDCAWVAAGASAASWFAENRESMQAKAAHAAEKEDKFVLKPQDGVDLLIP
jgi:hypothetical protein